MKRYFILLTCLLAIVLSLGVSAQPPLLNDMADVFTEGEEAELLAMLEGYSEKNGVDFVVVTAGDLLGYYDAEEAATEHYEKSGYSIDGVMLFLSVTDEYIDYYLLTSGSCIDLVDFGEVLDIEDEYTKKLEDDLFFEAAAVFAERSDYYFSYEAPYPLVLCIIISLAVGAIAALIVTGIMKGQLKSVKQQTRANSYLKGDSMQITESRDLYLYSSVTKTKKVQNNSGTHTSSSGRSYGGHGGRISR